MTFPGGPASNRPRRPPKLIQEVPTWRERMRATRHLPEFFRLVWETNRFYSALIVLLRALRAAIPIATLWIGKLIIDEVVRVLGEPGVAASGIQAYRHVLLLVGVGRVAIVGEILARASSLLESLLGDLFANRTSVN